MIVFVRLRPIFRFTIGDDYTVGEGLAPPEKERFKITFRLRIGDGLTFTCLAAARSRRGSYSPPGCNSLPRRRFATRDRGRCQDIFEVKLNDIDS